MELYGSMKLIRVTTILCLIVIYGDWVAGFLEKQSKFQGLYDLGDLGLSDLDGMIIAIGDSNADQYRDIFTLSGDQRSISLHLWNRKHSEFVSVSNNPVIPQTVGQFLITNIVLTDINYDGRLDILVMGVTDPKTDYSSTLKMEVWYGLDGTSFAPGVTIPSSLSPHPILFDSQGSMSMDLLGLPSSLPSVFKIWKNQAFHSNTSTPFLIADLPFTSPVHCKLPNPHSSAYIDLDGDCLADIFLTCDDGNEEQSYQIWINKKSQGYSLARTDKLPFGTKRISFADMDRDGTIDLVLATCPTPDECSIHVAYNQQIPLCNTRSKSKCRDPQNLCTSDPDFRFSFDSTKSGFTTLNIGHLFPDSRLMTELSSEEFIGPSPISIQIGDYNLDGYPDLLLIVQPTNSQSGGVPQILASVPCTRAVCTALETEHHRRAFRTLTTGAETLNLIDDAQGVFFLDINEDGSLDIVVQRKAHDRNGIASRKIAFIKNNYFNDAFFLKAIMLNGACSSRCPAKDNQDEYKPYGVNYAGASYKFTIQDTYGQRRATAVGQMPFNLYASPTTPYCFFGLGRTNNYVENLFIGSTRHQPKHYINIEGVLPNSQLVVIPYQKIGDDSTHSWKKQIYLKPGDWIPWVILSLTLATFVLAVIVAVLHINEKREDELERRRKAHTINFDAL